MIAEQLYKMADDMLGPYRRLTLEAADEIERLRNERKNCPPASESEYVRRLEDEIERLRNWNRLLSEENRLLRENLTPRIAAKLGYAWPD